MGRIAGSLEAQTGSRGGVFRFSTDALPESERIAVFHEVFARRVLGMDVEPLGEEPFHTDMLVRQLPGLTIVWANATPLRATRTRELLADGRDGLAFQWSLSPGFGEHLKREIVLGQNDGILISCSDPGGIVLPERGRIVSLTFARDALSPLLRKGLDCAACPVPASVPALRLLGAYIEGLRSSAVEAMPGLEALAVSHVLDLLALALGATHRAAGLARRRGVRAAHLHAIKDDIAENAGGELSIETVAARHHLSPRHVQRLFEDESATFTEFVRGERLLRAYRMLASPRFAHMRIGDIALDAGFDDVSWFNRQFRKRFGMAPGDVRARANGE